MAPRITIISPYYSGVTRGNAMQAERKADVLAQLGCATRIVDLSLAEVGNEATWLRDELGRDRVPDLLIAIHALRTGPAAVQVAGELGVPLAVMIGGTDIRPGLETAATVPQI